MKFVIIAFLMPALHKPNDTINLKKYSVVTLRIMEKLHVSKRPNQYRDVGSLTIFVDENLFAMNATFSCKDRSNCNLVQGNDFSTRYYINPIIRVSPLLATILNKSRDTSEIVFRKAEAILVHEISHYWQLSFGNEPEPDDISELVKLNYEFEAYSVGFYYFLSKLAPTKLRTIMAEDKPFHKKEEILINEGATMIYPWRKKPFN